MRTFKGKRFSFNYPDYWELEEFAETGRAMLYAQRDSDGRRAFVAFTWPFTTDGTAAALANQFIGIFQTIDSFSLLERKAITLPGSKNVVLFKILNKFETGHLYEDALFIALGENLVLNVILSNPKSFDSRTQKIFKEVLDSIRIDGVPAQPEISPLPPEEGILPKPKTFLCCADCEGVDVTVKTHTIGENQVELCASCHRERTKKWWEFWK